MEVRDVRQASLLHTTVLLFAASSTAVYAQEPVQAWGATKNFVYQIDRVAASAAGAGSWQVKVIFSVANPIPGGSFPDALWNIKTAAPIVGGSLRVLVGWDAAEFTNTNSRGNLNSVVTAPSSVGAALPVSLNVLAGATAALPCDAANCAELGAVPLAGRFYVKTTVSPMAFPSGTVAAGVVAMEGRPVCPLTGPVLPGCPTVPGTAAALIPVKSEVKPFSFTGGTVAQRRPIVDIVLCKKCHDGNQHGDTVVPRLSLHGGNRNEELKLCVVCHNPNQTDIPYRAAGNEVSIDFKRMIHSIHAGGKRKTPLQIVGFQGTVADFSGVRFPGELRDCLKCHVQVNRKGTFELPLSTKVLGSTIQTGSTQATLTALRTVDVNPWNDLKITPTAATCSGCHDSGEVQRHMIQTGGASFSTLQQNIIPGVTEKCASCHGPGKKEDVRRAHEIGGER